MSCGRTSSSSRSPCQRQNTWISWTPSHFTLGEAQSNILHVQGIIVLGPVYMMKKQVGFLTDTCHKVQHKSLNVQPYFCRAWGQEQTVMDFLNMPAKSQRGLPSRPVVGCAVSIQLDLPPALIEEWFGK